MIPILYDDGERNFVTNGLGRLSDCLSCTVTEERNGIYECEFEYPITGIHYDDIEEGRLIYCIHDDTQVPQAFIIYSRSAPINGIVTFYAHHISYKLRTTVVMPFSATSITDAIDKIPLNTLPNTEFTFWTDKTVVRNFTITEPRALRGVLGGEDGSLLDVYGKGEYEWDMFNVKLYQNRGSDSGVEIRYGKNLTDITNSIDASDTYNAIVPFWKGQSETGAEVVVTLPEGAIVYSGATVRTAYLTDENLALIMTENNEPLEVTYSDVIAVPYDMSGDFETKPTVAQLRSAAQAYLESSNGWIANQNITVNFVQMWQTEEYKNVAPLQRARLCDTVSVYYPELGVEAVQKKVIKTTYNVLTEKYDEIELGDSRYSFADVVTQQILVDVPTKSMMDDAIQTATDLISGGLGGHVYLKPNADGHPEEILIMDDADYTQATKLWRWNVNGLGYSRNGYSGTYGTAITMDGQIVADYITTGTLNANLIKAGILSDVNGNTSFNLDTGVLTIRKGSINLGDGAFTVDNTGVFHATKGAIGNWSIQDDWLVCSSGAGNFTTLEESGLRMYRSNTKIAEISKYGILFQGEDSTTYFHVWYDGGFMVSPEGGTTGLDLYRTWFQIRYNDERDFYADSSRIRMRYSTWNYIECDSTGITMNGGNGIASYTQNASTITLKSEKAQVLLNAYGLTLVTGRQTTAHSGNLYITTAGIAYFANEGSSSRHIKHDIKPVEDECLNPKRLYDAKVIQYKYNDDFLSEDDENRGKDLVGFIVEDLDEVYPVAVQKEDEEDSRTWTWSPYRIIPAMLKLIQDQHKEIEMLKGGYDGKEN